MSNYTLKQNKADKDRPFLTYFYIIDEAGNEVWRSSEWDCSELYSDWVDAWDDEEAQKETLMEDFKSEVAEACIQYRIYVDLEDKFFDHWKQVERV